MNFSHTWHSTFQLVSDLDKCIQYFARSRHHFLRKQLFFRFATYRAPSISMQKQTRGRGNVFVNFLTLSDSGEGKKHLSFTARLERHAIVTTATKQRRTVISIWPSDNSIEFYFDLFQEKRWVLAHYFSGQVRLLTRICTLPQRQTEQTQHTSFHGRRKGIPVYYYLARY